MPSVCLSVCASVARDMFASVRSPGLDYCPHQSWKGEEGVEIKVPLFVVLFETHGLREIDLLFYFQHVFFTGGFRATRFLNSILLPLKANREQKIGIPFGIPRAFNFLFPG